MDCPLCGCAMRLRRGGSLYPGGRRRKFWRCSSTKCGATHSAHPDGTPTGVPADAATREARSAVHAAFDPLWRSGTMSRSDAYRRLAATLGISLAEAHIGLFDRDRCERALALLRSGFTPT